MSKLEFKRWILLPVSTLILMVIVGMIGKPAETPVKLSQNDLDSLDIKIGQMVMIGIGNMTEIGDSNELMKTIAQGKVGGVVLFEKNINAIASEKNLKNLISKMSAASKIPLWVSIDEEGGKVHRLKEKYGFISMPSAAAMGKMSPDSTYYFYNLLAAELKGLGINLNYAPVMDIALNKENTVVVKNNRCFSGTATGVSEHALACVKAHRNNQVMTVLKHFPGHGSSTTDSHHGIADVTKTWTFEELIPYSNLIKEGHTDAVMTGHLLNDKWDTVPSTLSSYVINGLLRNLMSFDGPVFSDDMQMYAIVLHYGRDKALELAINAGVDVMIFGNNVGKNEYPATALDIHTAIKNLVLQGKISMNRINQSYTRIIKSKQYLMK